MAGWEALAIRLWHLSVVDFHGRGGQVPVGGTLAVIASHGVHTTTTLAAVVLAVTLVNIFAAVSIGLEIKTRPACALVASFAVGAVVLTTSVVHSALIKVSTSGAVEWCCFSIDETIAESSIVVVMLTVSSAL